MAAATPVAPIPPVGPASVAPPTATIPPPPLSGSLRLTGTNRLANVRALQWVARGSTKVQGDVEIDSGDLTGSVAVGGKLDAHRLSLDGTHQIDGDLHVSDALRSRGTLRAGASVWARSARLAGAVDIEGTLTVAETLDWKGTLEVAHDIDAGAIIFDGRLTVGGTMTARSISGSIGSLSSANEIHADWIDIRHRRPLLPFPIFILPPPAWDELQVERIEATEVHLSGVRVRHLKADRIWLGAHTHVEYVEGTILERHKGAHVGPESESSPPPGLSR